MVVLFLLMLVFGTFRICVVVICRCRLSFLPSHKQTLIVVFFGLLLGHWVLMFVMLLIACVVDDCRLLIPVLSISALLSGWEWWSIYQVSFIIVWWLMLAYTWGFSVAFLRFITHVVCIDSPVVDSPTMIAESHGDVICLLIRWGNHVIMIRFPTAGTNLTTLIMHRCLRQRSIMTLSA